MRVKTRYKNSPIADTSSAVSQQPSLADVPGGSVAGTALAGNDPSLAIAQQIDALNLSERSQHDRIAFQKQMVALHPEQYRTQEAAPPRPTPRQQPRDFFQPPAPRSERSASAHFVSAPVSREVPDGQYFAQRPGRVTLTAPQKEAARIAGCSEVAYAAQLGELERRKKDGFYDT